MSLKKLLMAASTAALFAGAASALTVTQGDGAFGGPAAGVSSNTTLPGTAVITTNQFVAEEATFAASGSDEGLFELTVNSTGTFAASENYFVDVTVSGGTFAETLDGDEVTDGDTSVGASGLSISGSSIQILGQTQTGQVGENQVRFLVSNSPQAGNEFGIELPIAYAGCPADLNFTISIETTGGTVFEEGTVSLATPALQCANAYEATIASDVIGTNNDTVLASSAFERFDITPLVSTSDTDRDADGTFDNGSATALAAQTGGPNDSAARGSFGVVTVDFNPDAVTAPGGFLTSLDSALSANLTGAATEVTSVDFDVEVTNATGLAGVSVLGAAAGSPASIATGTASVSAAVAPVLTVNDFIENITIELAAVAAQVAQQPVETTNGLLIFGAGPSVEPSEPVADATLDDLNFEGVTCGPFDWVGDAARPTQNIFRITGHGPATTAVVATLSNATAGTAFNGPYTLTEPYNFNNEEVVVNTQHITDVAGDFVRADLLLNFIGAQTSLDCDRLMNSDNQNIITAFGNKDTSAGAVVTDGDDD